MKSLLKNIDSVSFSISLNKLLSFFKTRKNATVFVFFCLESKPFFQKNRSFADMKPFESLIVGRDPDLLLLVGECKNRKPLQKEKFSCCVEILTFPIDLDTVHLHRLVFAYFRGDFE